MFVYCRRRTFGVYAMLVVNKMKQMKILKE